MTAKPKLGVVTRAFFLGVDGQRRAVSVQLVGEPLAVVIPLADGQAEPAQGDEVAVTDASGRWALA